MNKYDRNANHKRVLIKRAKKLKCFGPIEELPLPTRMALSSTGSLRVGRRSIGERKTHFGKSSGKRYYGHFSGFTSYRGAKCDLLERAIIQNHKEYNKQSEYE